MAYRVVAKFEDQKIKKTLQPGENVIGSDPGCEVCLRNTTVSRRHAVLNVGPDSVVIRDLGSTNGTLLRSQRIDGSEEVHPGDTFVIGRVVVLLEEVEDDDLEVGIHLPRVGVDPSGTIDIDTSEITDMVTPADRFSLEKLPQLLGHLYRGADRQELAQRVGAAIAETMPVLKVEVTEEGAGSERGILYTFTKDDDTPGLPRWAEARVGISSVRACFQTRRAGTHFQPVIDATALILGLAEAREPDAHDREAPPATAERPQPPTADPTVRLIYDQAERVARGDVGVLIYGESGTGKEVLANFIHAASPRVDQPLVAINCASLPRDLLEAELFGVERGVATGVEARPGKFEAAHGGTLFLDEIGDMAPETQAKILRVLQERRVYRIGGHTPRPAEARIVAATNRPIQRMIAEGTFRNDLYHRIATWEVELPPLRRRRGDVANLAIHFLALEAKAHGLRAKGISRAAVRELEGYDWPGNIRQLRNEIARAVLFLEKGDLLDTQRLSPQIRDAKSGRGTSLASILESVEREEIKKVLEEVQGDTAVAAERLEMSRPTLYRRIKHLGIQVPDTK